MLKRTDSPAFSVENDDDEILDLVRTGFYGLASRAVRITLLDDVHVLTAAVLIMTPQGVFPYLLHVQSKHFELTSLYAKRFAQLQSEMEPLLIQA